ncbi:MAG: cell division protein FtsQ/DivIB [Pseudomonadota bacterium]
MSAIAMRENAFEPDAPVAATRLSRLALGIAALLAAIMAAWTFVRVAGDRPVERLLIEGEFRHVSADEVETIARPLVDTSFVDVKLDRLRAELLALPWVARVRAEREWPATVRLRLWERVPAARWGEAALLDVDAVAFDPTGREVPSPLPRLSGPEGSAAAVLETYRQLSARLAGTPFALEGLAQDARGDWTGYTVDGIALRFGRGDPGASLPVLLGPAARALAQDVARVAYVDLRYTNGFSVGWREPAAATEGN